MDKQERIAKVVRLDKKFCIRFYSRGDLTDEWLHLDAVEFENPEELVRMVQKPRDQK